MTGERPRPTASPSGAPGARSSAGPRTGASPSGPSPSGASPDGHPGARPVPAGIVASLVGFVGSATVVLAGLTAVGASDGQAASGLLALSVAMGVVGAGLALRTHLPLSMAWSTPGAALLLASGAPDGGFAAAIGAFLVCGALLAASGLWGALVRLITAIPTPLAAAMVAGILLPVCFGPVQAVADIPGQAIPVVVVWGVLVLTARRLAVTGALVAMVVVVAASGELHLGPAADLLPRPELTAPAFDLGAIVGLGLPLFVVTMVSQNVAGAGVLASFGYRTPMRPVLVSTGIGTVLSAPFGGHAINLAAISAPLFAGPDAGPHARRWVAVVAGGVASVVLGLLAGVVVAFVGAAPPILVQAVAGLALLAALEPALGAAFADERLRPEVVATVVVSASGVTIVGVSGAFWGLVVGLAVHLLRSRRRA